MIVVKHYDDDGNLISKRKFNTPDEVSAFYMRKPKDGCWNCMKYDPSKGACTLSWNNGDDKYYNPDLDNKDPDDYCGEHETDPDAEWEDFGGDE